MPERRFAILDPAAGISGDMLLGALVAAGAPRTWLEELPARLGLSEVAIGIREVDRCGIRAVKVDVQLPGGATETPAEILPHHHHHHDSHDHNHSHDHTPSHADLSHHHHHGPHRHVGELIDMIARAPLSPWVRERAVRAFQLLGEAEGRVHGVPADAVALHEVGAVDAVVDIVGAIEGFEQLGITEIYARPVAVGNGWVRAAHGVLAVPAPATALLLEGLEIGPNGPVTGEATTPTGAVLLRVLSRGAPPVRWRPTGQVGWGAGGRDPAGYPNALRLFVAEPVAEAADVVLLATDIDDLSPEYLEPIREALGAAGALDVQVWPTQMKKGRIGFRVEVVVTSKDAEAVTQALFRHSTTAGIRRSSAVRTTLDRHEIMVEVEHGIMARVKVLDGPDGPRVKPEYDDVADISRRLGRPAHQVAGDLRWRALRQLGLAPAGGPEIPNKEP